MQRYKVIDLRKSEKHVENKLNEYTEKGYYLYRFTDTHIILYYISEEELKEAKDRVNQVQFMQFGDKTPDGTGTPMH